MMCFRHILLVVTIPCVMTDAGYFTVTTKDTASLLGGDQEVECTISHKPVEETGSNVSTTEAYTITWNFTAVGTQNPVTILRLVKQQKNFSLDWSANSKYKQSRETNLKIFGISEFDGGTYTCILESTLQVASSSAEVFVVEQASCHNSKDTYYAGERTDYSCLVGFHGNKAPTIYWTMGNERINASDVQISKNGNVVKATLGIITNSHLNGYSYNCYIEYAGVFRTSCHTKSPLVLNISFPVQDLIVTVHPPRREFTYAKGTELIWMSCRTRGNPEPKYLWTFSAADGRGPRDIARRQHYRIENAKLTDQGNYTCTAYNVIKGISYNKMKTVFIKIVESSEVSYGGYQHVSHNTDSKVTGDSKNKKETEHSGDLNNSTLQKKLPRSRLLSPYAIGAIVTAALAIILIIVFIFLALKFKARDRRMRQQFSRIHDENLDDQEVELLDENIQPTTDSEPSRLKQFWEIPRKDIRMTDLISRGSYVEVWKGKMRKIPEKDEVIRIAIKKISDEATEKDRKFFLAEMEVLKMLKSHINIIQIIGCYTLNEPWLIMLEYAQDGTLFEYLQNGRPGADQEVEITSNARQAVKLKKKKLDSYRLLALAAQVANGLEHLNRFKLIYYRLRALSVLMAKGGICKLSGFGFPQDIRERNCYESNSAPIRWMSPESIKEKVYNVKTDVWSYGITMWEILHFGATPYPDMGPQEAEESILSGYIMPQPVHCSDKVYGIITSCLDQNPENRPGYNTILQLLTGLAAEHASHVNLEKLPTFVDSLNSTDFSRAPEQNAISTENKTVT